MFERWQSNGMLERWHSTLRVAIMVHDEPSRSQVLPLVLLALRTTNREFVASPGELLYRENLRLPSDPVLDITSDLNTTGSLPLLKEAMLKFGQPSYCSDRII